MTNQLDQKKNKIDVGHMALAFLPFVVLLCIQTGVTMIPMIIAIFQLRASGELEQIQPSDITAKLLEQMGDSYMWFLCLYAIISIVVFFLWYRKLNGGKKALKVDYSKTFNIKNTIALVIMALGLNFATSAFLEIVNYIFPSSIDAYNDMMNSTFGASSILPLIIYGAILGPIAEEMCIRGTTIAHLKLSRCKVWVMLLIQAVIFGVTHLNLVQGIYASVLGFVLGLIAYKTSSVIPAIVTHIIYNFFGLFVTGAVLLIFEGNIIATAIIEILAIGITISGYMLFRKTKPSFKTTA